MKIKQTRSPRYVCFMAAVVIAVGVTYMAAADALEKGFASPPDSAKPQTWWHWADGNISRGGITAELEAMKRIGLGGAHMFTVGGYPPVLNPKVPCLSPAWHEMIRHTLTECNRLGLAFTVQNCAGWSNAGGPWITPDKAVQHVVWSPRMVSGGETVTWKAPPSWPESGDTYYRDIAVLAFPTPDVYRNASPLPTPKVTSNLAGIDTNGLHRDEAEADRLSIIDPTIVAPDKTGWVQFEFPSPVTCRSVKLTGG